MKLYVVCHKHEVRKLFFNEKIMIPKNSTGNNFKANSESKNYICLYKEINRNMIGEKLFFIQLEIKLKDINYIKIKDNYIVFNDIYLDDNSNKLKKIYYSNDESYNELMTDLMLISEAKLVKKYSKRICKLDFEKLKEEFNYEDISKYNLNTIRAENIEKKKSIIFDSLKGSLYFATKMHPKILIKYNKEMKIANEIIHVSKIVNSFQEDLANMKKEKRKINNILNRKVQENRIKIIDNIENSDRRIFKIRDKRKFDVNFFIDTKIVAKRDQKLINIIMEIIVFEKFIDKMNDENKLKKSIVSRLIEVSSNNEDLKYINKDIMILNEVTIKRNLEYSYKAITNNIIKFLYFALEYNKNISALNSIVRDYKFENYFVIYSFIGAFVGYEKLSKTYTDNLNIDVFNKRLYKELNDILKELDEVYRVKQYYKKLNEFIISELIKEKNYYKMVDKYCFKKTNNSEIKISRINRDKSLIEIDKRFKVYMYKDVNNGNGKIDSKFTKFKYYNTLGKKLKYDEEIELSYELERILKTL